MAVIRLLDHIRKRSRGHAALMRVLQRPMKETATDSDFADEILLGLWQEGFKIVPRDDK